MSDPKTLRVLPKGSAMVANYEAQENIYSVTRSFIGRPFDREAGEDFLDPQTKVKRKTGAFVATPGAVVEVPNRAEYRLHVSRHKDLWAADQETADACGVAFDAKFGDEHPPETVAKSLRALKAPPPDVAPPPALPSASPAATPATPPSPATKGA
jgi:hypothetical protein